MHVQDDGISSSFDSDHRLGENVAGDAADDVFGPQAAVCALAVAAIPELPLGVIGEDDALLALVANNARLRIGDFATARQLKLQERAVALERN